MTIVVTDVDGDIFVDGSIRLVPTLLEHRLVYERRPMVSPVILRRRPRPFVVTRGNEPVRLAASRTVGDGIAVLTHEATV